MLGGGVAASFGAQQDGERDGVDSALGRRGSARIAPDLMGAMKHDRYFAAKFGYLRSDDTNGRL
jgi:hypothetical protein